MRIQFILDECSFETELMIEGLFGSDILAEYSGEFIGNELMLFVIRRSRSIRSYDYDMYYYSFQIKSKERLTNW